LDQRENGWTAAGIVRQGFCQTRHNDPAKEGEHAGVRLAAWRIEVCEVMGKMKGLADPDEPETLAC
jgi:uncharacterized protein YaeQ